MATAILFLLSPLYIPRRPGAGAGVRARKEMEYHCLTLKSSESDPIGNSVQISVIDKQS